MPYEIRGRLKKSTDEHSVIFDAILSGDGERACNRLLTLLISQEYSPQEVVSGILQQSQILLIGLLYRA